MTRWGLVADNCHGILLLDSSPRSIHSIICSSIQLAISRVFFFFSSSFIYPSAARLPLSASVEEELCTVKRQDESSQQLHAEQANAALIWSKKWKVWGEANVVREPECVSLTSEPCLLCAVKKANAVNSVSREARAHLARCRCGLLQAKGTFSLNAWTA